MCIRFAPRSAGMQCSKAADAAAKLPTLATPSPLRVDAEREGAVSWHDVVRTEFESCRILMQSRPYPQIGCGYRAAIGVWKRGDVDRSGVIELTGDHSTYTG